MGVSRFEELVAWRESRELVRAVYAASLEGPLARDFGLRDQLRRAAVSVMSNIAEGFERSRPKEFHQALSISKGSCAEVRSLLYVAHDVGYIDDQTFDALQELAKRAGNLVGGLRRAVERRVRAAPSG